MSRTHNLPSNPAAQILICAGILLAALTLDAQTAQAEDLDEYKEVSYLVFKRSQGFDRPEFKADRLDGTVTVRFAKLPEAWHAMLHPQTLSERKRRFFSRMTPLVENGKLAGIRVWIGVGSFRIKTYAKRGPTRWVLRVGELRTPPFDPGPEGVPVVPYSDLVDEEVEGRAAFASAEHSLSQGRLGSACQVFQALRNGHKELRSWAGLREADCLLAEGRHALALDLLKSVVSAGHTPAAISLARIRIDEASGKVLGPRFDRSIYRVDSSTLSYMGTVADEIGYREARALLFRREAHLALDAMEVLLADRPRSPFFQDRRFVHALRWRAVRDAAADREWLLTSRTYLSIPPSPITMPHWVEIHEIGAHALREVGLPMRAVQVYLHLLRTDGIDLSEKATILQLAEAYYEAGDAYRARITLKYLVERFPRMTRHPKVVRIRGRLALDRGDDAEAGRQAAAMLKAQPAANDTDDARFVASAAARALETEGLPSARETLSTLPGPLVSAMRIELAMAAGDCAQLTEHLGPLPLADAEELLWSGACLMTQRRHTEALIYLEAARVYAGAELMLPELEPILEAVLASARWWAKTQTTANQSPKRGDLDV